MLVQREALVTSCRIGTGVDTIHFALSLTSDFRPFGQARWGSNRTVCSSHNFPTLPLFPMSDASAPDDRSFEDTLNRLEEIVERLEENPPALDEALDAYEEGVALANDCLSRLNDAEQRMSELSIDGD